MPAARLKLLLGIIYSFGLSALLTYVPWYGTNPIYGRFEVGHAWIWACPDGRALLDVTTIGVELGAWTAIMGAFYFFAKLRELKPIMASSPSRA